MISSPKLDPPRTDETIGTNGRFQILESRRHSAEAELRTPRRAPCLVQMPLRTPEGLVHVFTAARDGC